MQEESFESEQKAYPQAPLQDVTWEYLWSEGAKSTKVSFTWEKVSQKDPLQVLLLGIFSLSAVGLLSFITISSWALLLQALVMTLILTTTFQQVRLAKRNKEAARILPNTKSSKKDLTEAQKYKEMVHQKILFYISCRIESLLDLIQKEKVYQNASLQGELFSDLTKENVLKEVALDLESLKELDKLSFLSKRALKEQERLRGRIVEVVKLVNTLQEEIVILQAQKRAGVTFAKDRLDESISLLSQYTKAKKELESKELLQKELAQERRQKELEPGPYLTGQS